MKYFLYLFRLVLLLFFTQNCFSQQIYGVILDEETKEPIQGASVYFDATTIGVSTNDKGEFVLDYNPNLKNPLVISFMGYKTIRMTKIYANQEQKIYLKEDNESLNEITINADDGIPRATKLKEFLKHFLGNTENGRACEILNEEDVILRYIKEGKQIIANSKTPLIIKNQNLKYLISVDLNHFVVNYSYISKNKKHLTANNISYSGSNYYQSLEKNVSLETNKKRKRAYEGSTLHFMRAVSNNELVERGYQIIRSDGKHSNSAIKVQKIGSTSKVKIKYKVHVRYKNNIESTIEVLTDSFSIDSFGNHTPPDKVRFEGDFANQRMGDALPLDYLMVDSK